jgi:asparagine synthase (glutamine-hydrolysing)
MCGIFVVSSREELTEEEINEFKKVSQLLSHRGPDADGFYISPNKKVFMAHKRLSIIDLSEKSNQPMKRNNLVIVFNGEIYNFKEIREILEKKGHQFATNSDTEVILSAYQEFGMDCLSLLKGMFAFCIYDEKENILFCSRDRVGEKPMVYYKNERYIILSSEIKPIVELSFFKKSIDKESLFLYFLGNYRHIPEPFSIWQGVRKLKPASFIIIKDGDILKEDFYYQPKINYEIKNYSKEQIKKIVKEKVIESIKLTSVADVPISILLSGGVDSSIIAYVLKTILKKDVVAFTYGASPDDEEVKRAKYVAERLKIPHKIFYFDHIDVEKRIKNIIKIYAEPLSLLQFAYSDVLYEAIKREGFKVVITGNGSDELFYGYISHPKTLLFSYMFKILDNLKIIDNIKLKILKYWLTSKKNRSPFDLSITLSLFKEYEKFIKSFVDSYLIDFSNFWGLISENAHSITLVGDVSGMKNSVEVRNPFLNHELIELAYSLNPRLKIKNLLDKRGEYTKWILKEIFRGSPIEEVFYLPKMGFGFNIPLDYRFKNLNEFRKWSLRVFSKEFGVEVNMFSFV